MCIAESRAAGNDCIKNRSSDAKPPEECWVSKVIFVATNASRENNKVRASERRQPLTVEQMSAEQERYGNQTSDVQIHVWQRIRFAR